MKALHPDNFPSSYRLNDTLEYPVLTLAKVQSPYYAASLSNLVAGLLEDDFVRSGLDPETPARYANPQLAASSTRQLECAVRARRPEAPYTVNASRLTDTLEATTVGFANLANISGTSPAERLKQRLQVEPGIRLFTGWLRPEHLASYELDAESVADSTMRAMTDIARGAGLRSLRMAVAEGLPGAQKITVIGQVVEPSEYGFRQTGEESVTVEGRVYPSAVFEKRF